MTRWSDTVTSRRYTVTFISESGRSSDISAGEALTSLLLFFGSYDVDYLSIRYGFSIFAGHFSQMKITRTKKVIAGLVLGAVVAIAGMIYVCDAKVVSASADRCFESVDSLTECETGVLLGTSIRGCYTDVNPFFRPRINGILDLYRAGKIKRIYITGDSASVD